MKVTVSEGRQGEMWGKRKGRAVFHNRIYGNIWLFKLYARVTLIKIKTERERGKEKHCFRRGYFSHRRDGEKPTSSWVPGLISQGRKEAETQADAAVQAQRMSSLQLPLSGATVCWAEDSSLHALSTRLSPAASDPPQEPEAALP